MRWMLAMGLVGCAAEVEPRASVAATACGIDEPLPWTVSVFTAPEVDAACAEALAEDFGIADPTVSADSPEGSALAGAYVLLAQDWGVGVGGDSAFEESLVEVARVTGDDRVGWLAYDYAAARIRRLREASLAEGISARWLSMRRMVEWGEVLPAVGAAGVLVHEARHGDGERHVHCALGENACDVDGAGSYGFEGELFRRAEAQADGVVATTLGYLAEDAESRVMTSGFDQTFTPEQGRVLRRSPQLQ